MNEKANQFNGASMTPADYLRDRVDDQLSWYGKKSALNKKWYFTLQLVTMIAAASIPVFSLSSGDMTIRILVAVIGSVTAIAAGVTSLYQLKDQWIDYRSTAEAVKFEKFLFVTGSEPYSENDSFSLFVHRIESIFSQENRSWQQKKFDAEFGSEPVNPVDQHSDREA